jgi:chemotaxis protein methyltransferase CheR
VVASHAQWAEVRAFLTARTGMSLSGPQVRRLDERLAARGRGLTPHQYLMFLKSPSGEAELEELIAAVVVHKTDLFRDEVQLEAFRAQVLLPLVDRSHRPLRVWSAGCATGEEVATLLVLLAEAGADPGSTVLGTDICAGALQRAQQLGFTPEQLRRVPPKSRERYFSGTGNAWSLAPHLRERASFQLHNLMDRPYPAPPGGLGFDVIFCRNVLIYFTPDAFQQTVEALATSLAPGGTLVLSASEPLLKVPPSLRVLRGESAFFYVRADGAQDGLLVPPKRDSGRFPVVATPPPKGDSGRFATPASASPKRDSGRFPSVASGTPKPDSGRFPVPAGQVPGTPKPDSGRFPVPPGQVPGTPKPDSGRFPVAASERPTSPPKRNSGRFPVVVPGKVPGTPKPDSGRFPTMPTGQGSSASMPDSGRLPATPSGQGSSASTPDSGRFPAVPSAQASSASKRDSGRFPAVPSERLPAAPRPDSGRIPAVGAEQVPTPPARDSGRFPAIGADPEPAPVPASFAEADLLFAHVLDGASSGVPDAVSERDLRKCLSLDPDHAAARYLLGLLLEQCGRPAEAATEYRRALQSLEAGRARPTPFFLNPARLRVACAHAAERLEANGRGR